MKLGTVFQIYLNLLFILSGLGFYLLLSGYPLYASLVFAICFVVGNVWGRVLFRRVPSAIFRWFTDSLIGDMGLKSSSIMKGSDMDFTMMDYKKR